MLSQFYQIFIVLGSCQSKEKLPISLNAHAAMTADLVALAGPIFQKLKDSLDTEHTVSITAKQQVKIFFTRFKSNANKIYAVSSKGDEILYAGMMKDPQNGKIAIFKSGESILIDIDNGVPSITELNEKWTSYFALLHGGEPGEFCQREPGETFKQCYTAEKDEFCDSFISCVAADTQPFVAIAIASACSCMIDGPL
jgi:hypothetical protein